MYFIRCRQQNTEGTRDGTQKQLSTRYYFLQVSHRGLSYFCQRRVCVPWGSSTYPVSLAYFSCLHTRLLFRFRSTENLEL
jgi:hypothetical protein